MVFHHDVYIIANIKKYGSTSSFWTPDAAAVVFDQHVEQRRTARRRVAPGRLNHDARARPLARVVEQVAEHLVEILALAADGVRRPDPHVDRDAALGVQAQQRARQRRPPSRRPRQRAPGVAPDAAARACARW